MPGLAPTTRGARRCPSRSVNALLRPTINAEVAQRTDVEAAYLPASALGTSTSRPRGPLARRIRARAKRRRACEADLEPIGCHPCSSHVSWPEQTLAVAPRTLLTTGLNAVFDWAGSETRHGLPGAAAMQAPDTIQPAQVLTGGGADVAKGVCGALRLPRNANLSGLVPGGDAVARHPRHRVARGASARTR